MRRFLTPDRRGLTLMETLIVIIVVGVLAAIGAPNVLATLSGNRVREGVGIVRTALQDAQLQAIRLGRECTVELVLESGGTYFDRLRATPVGCFVAGETTTETSGVITSQIIRLPRGIRFSVPPDGSGLGTFPRFRFSFKGHLIGYSLLAPSGQIPTFVIFAVDDSSRQPFLSNQYPKKCLMVASMLGMIRGGTYRVPTTLNPLAPAQISSANCDPFLEGRQ